MAALLKWWRFHCRVQLFYLLSTAWLAISTNPLRSYVRLLINHARSWEPLMNRIQSEDCTALSHFHYTPVTTFRFLNDFECRIWTYGRFLNRELLYHWAKSYVPTEKSVTVVSYPFEIQNATLLMTFRLLDLLNRIFKIHKLPCLPINLDIAVIR